MSAVIEEFLEKRKAVAAELRALDAAIAAYRHALNGAAPSPGAASSAPRPSTRASLGPSPSPSLAPTASPPSAVPSADPAIAALDAMEAAIGAARGGPDGLKGKEANDLETRTAAVRRALENGDRAAAREEARKLDRRIDDVVKGLSDDRAARLRAASADLLRSLGG